MIPSLDSIVPGYLYQSMADHIAACITSGELAPNKPLPNERHLAEEYCVSLDTASRAPSNYCASASR